MELLLLGVIPPTDLERRARELQRELYARHDLAEALALPVLIPLSVRGARSAESVPAPPPPGRLEAPALRTAGFTVQDQWLLWSIQAAPALGKLARAWSESFDKAREPTGQGSRLPLGAGFPLAFSPTDTLLEAARSHLGVEAPHSFRPLELALYRLRALSPGERPGETAGLDAGATDRVGGRTVGVSEWAELFRRGVFWEEIGRKPLRRQV